MAWFQIKRQNIPKEEESEHIKIHADPSGKLYVKLSDLFEDTDLIDELKNSSIYKHIQDTSKKYSMQSKSDAR
jgi:hypothetical protein